MEKPGMQKEKEQDKNTSEITDEERMKDPSEGNVAEAGIQATEGTQGVVSGEVSRAVSEGGG